MIITLAGLYKLLSICMVKRHPNNILRLVWDPCQLCFCSDSNYKGIGVFEQVRRSALQLCLSKMPIQYGAILRHCMNSSTQLNQCSFTSAASLKKYCLGSTIYTYLLFVLHWDSPSFCGWRGTQMLLHQFQHPCYKWYPFLNKILTFLGSLF